MKQDNSIPDDIRRFVLHNIDSVSHLEAILLFYRSPEMEWDVKTMAENLYVSEKTAREMLNDLHAKGFVSITHHSLYRYNVMSSELKSVMERLSECYAKSLLDVMNMIHSKTNKQAKNFGDAFKWHQEEGG